MGKVKPRKTKKVIINKDIVEFLDFDMRDLIYGSDGKFLNPRIAIIAKSGSGKSWVVRDIMYHLPNIPCGVVIAPTDKMTKFYDTIVPALYIYHEYKDGIFDKLFARQEAMLAKNRRRIKHDKKPVDPRSFLIMDDCMSSAKVWSKDPKITSMMYEGRHYGFTFILTMQYSIGLPPELRSQFDFVFLLGEDIYSNKKKLYEHYAGMFPAFRVFETIFEQLTDNYGCMVINNRIRMKDIKKKIFHYRAKKRGEFKIGDKKYWKFHEDHYNSKHNRSRIKDINNILLNRRIRGL
jgi:hypothetical protein